MESPSVPEGGGHRTISVSECFYSLWCCVIMCRVYRLYKYYQYLTNTHTENIFRLLEVYQHMSAQVDIEIIYPLCLWLQLHAMSKTQLTFKPSQNRAVMG